MLRLLISNFCAVFKLTSNCLIYLLEGDGAQVIKLTGWYIILFSVLAEREFNLEADVLL